ncbi:MAG: PepSY-associated TM helix domain-containing protein [Pseudomonadota bacterium]
MFNSYRQSMTWLHTWSGLSLCWLLYFMFVTGTLGYFDSEIDLWMTPEVPSQFGKGSDSTTLANITLAQSKLEEVAPDAQRWFISPEAARETPRLTIGWLPKAGEDSTQPQFQNRILDPATGEFATARETGGGQLLYRMHYLLHYLPGRMGYWIATFATMLMFIGLISGVIAHKKIFKDFFTFRWARGQRSWLDAHNLLSVSTLPFQLMITYSGLVFTLGLFWMPFVVLGGYGFDMQRVAGLQDVLRGPVVERAEAPGTLLPLAELTQTAIETWDDKSLRILIVESPGDENATVTVQGAGVGRNRPTARYMGVSGELVDESREISLPNGALHFALASVDLHEGIFAGPFLRWLYFLAGTMGAAMVATGAIYWVESRRKKDVSATYSRGHRFVRKMNVATIAGLLVAIGVYFWANRLLPIDLEGREQWEVHCMFLALLGCFAHASLRSHEQAWIEQLHLLAATFVLLPVVNGLTTDMGLVHTIGRGDWTIAGFDLTALATGALAFAAARHLAHKGEEQRPIETPITLTEHTAGS